MTDRYFLKGRPALWVAGFLLVALVLSQTIGLFHGIVHGALRPTLPAQAGFDRSAATPPSPDGVARLSDKLFGSHGGHGETPDCRLYDQCSHGDALAPMPELALPLVLSTYVLLILSGLARARWHAHFQARGPPLVR